MQEYPTIPQPTPPNNNDYQVPDEPVVVTAKGPEGWRSIASTLLILIAAPLIAIALTTYVFQSYEVDGPSMETTLQNQDRLIVWKAPVTWAEISNNEYLPPRGEVIVFHRKGLADGTQSDDKQLIKRVIALPGERVVVKDGLLTVYNAENPNGFNPDEDTQYIKDAISTSGNVDMIVPRGEVFVCGDNRSNSLDSRYFGTVPTTDIIGTLAMRIFPINKAKAF